MIQITNNWLRYLYLIIIKQFTGIMLDMRRSVDIWMKVSEPNIIIVNSYFRQLQFKLTFNIHNTKLIIY